MSKSNTATTRNGVRLSVVPARNSKGQFINSNSVTLKQSSAVSQSSVKPNRKLVRNAKGQFVSPVSNAVVNVKNEPVKTEATTQFRDSRGRFVNLKQENSSFILLMRVDGSNVNVVMQKNPRITYTFRPSVEGLRAVKQALKDNARLGSVYHKYLRGKEFSRTIFKSDRVL